MKRMRYYSKTGFTLLEVLLATAILVIGSTMIMKGFISVMVFARNNRNYAKSAALNSRSAYTQLLAHFATASDQFTAYSELANGDSNDLTLSYDPTHYSGYSGSVTLPTLQIEVHSYSDADVPVFGESSRHTLEVDGDRIDSSTTSNNRFAFFYDFSDFIGGGAGDCIIRYGYLFNKNPIAGYTVPIYDGNTGAQIGWGKYGWYCFNAHHCSQGEFDSLPTADQPSYTVCPYRSSTYTPAH